MRTRKGLVVLAAWLVLGVLAAGCSGGDDREAADTTATTTTNVGIPAVDDIIDRVVSGSRAIRTVDGTTTSESRGQLQEAARDFRAATKRLEQGVPVVPASSVDSATASLESMGAALDAAVDCLDDAPASDARACASTSAVVRDRATAVASALLQMIPYGTRSNQEVVALLNPGTRRAP